MKKGKQKEDPNGSASADTQKAGAAKANGKAPEDPKKERKKVVIDRPATQILDVDLTPDEINLYARESARLHGDLANLEQRKKDAMADFKARISGVTSRIGELNRKIESGSEQREVDCIWRFDYEAGTKTLFRIDAGDLIEVKSYPLLPEERQMALPIKETLADKVNQAAARKASGEENAPPLESEDQVHSGVVPRESTEERKLRIFFNSLASKEKRKEFLGISSESAEVEALLTLPYRRLSETDRDIVRACFKASQEAKAAEQPAEVEEIPDEASQLEAPEAE